MKRIFKTKLIALLQETPSPKLMLVVTGGIILALIAYITILLLSMR